MYSRNNLRVSLSENKGSLSSPESCIYKLYNCIYFVCKYKDRLSYKLLTYIFIFMQGPVICSLLLLTTGYKTSGKVYIYKTWSYLWSQFDLQNPSKLFNKLQIRDLNKFDIQCFIWSQQQQDW